MVEVVEGAGGPKKKARKKIRITPFESCPNLEAIFPPAPPAPSLAVDSCWGACARWEGVVTLGLRIWLALGGLRACAGPVVGWGGGRGEGLVVLARCSSCSSEDLGSLRKGDDGSGRMVRTRRSGSGCC